MAKLILGIDVGGSGIKGAPVDIEKGVFTEERYRIPTPEGATPLDVAQVISQISEHFNWKAPIGCGFPAAIRDGKALTAANIDDSWIGVDVGSLIQKETGCSTNILNDADAAGLAEITFGVGKNVKGTILMITIGTGLGSALFINGQLYPNSEFGHLILKKDKIAEHYASDAVRKEKDLNWEKWGKRLNVYLQHVERLVWPKLIILGGGVSKKHSNFLPYLNLKAKITPAKLLNQAGIIGAACSAKYLL